MKKKVTELQKENNISYKETGQTPSVLLAYWYIQYNQIQNITLNTIAQLVEKWRKYVF